jgi:hypothetical protein
MFNRCVSFDRLRSFKAPFQTEKPLVAPSNMLPTQVEEQSTAGATSRLSVSQGGRRAPTVVAVQLAVADIYTHWGQGVVS